MASFKTISFLLVYVSCLAQPKEIFLRENLSVNASKKKSLVTGVQSRPERTNTQYSTSFSLASPALVSAGVYTKTGKLVRTLFSGVNYPAGRHHVNWDGLDDYQQRITIPTNYDIHILSNNITASWDGVIANTSDSSSGPTVHRGWDSFRDMVVLGKTIYYAKGYSEGAPSHIKFSATDIQKRIVILPQSRTGQNVRFVDTDGTRVYWGGNDSFSTKNFVFATDVSNDLETKFSSGSSLKLRGGGYTYASVIDTTTATITGMSVQRKGNYLFVSHLESNRIDVLDKVTGSLVRTLTFKLPRNLTIDINDNLWVIFGTNSIQQFPVNSDGTLGTASLNLTDVDTPLDVAVSPTTGDILIADGGSKQQLRCYSSSGNLNWVYGKVGGYSVNATVSWDKFYFTDEAGFATKTFVTYTPDGSFWVGDSGNSRAVHFAANRSHIEHIMFLPKSYSAAVDRNNPSRVFSDFAEFQVDYSKPHSHLNRSWTLVRNWGGTIPPNLRTTRGANYNNLKNVVTLSNGRTYAEAKSTSPNNFQLIELTPEGVVRPTGVVTSTDGLTQLYKDGSLRKTNRVTTIGNPEKFTARLLTGFDTKNNPIYGPETQVASTGPTTSDDPLYKGNLLNIRPGEETTTGIFVAFDGSKASTKYHLGGVRRGTNEWLWRTAQNTASHYQGNYPIDGAYDIGNGATTTGTFQQALGRIILWGYHGEFWKSGQTNKYSLVYDNGLFLKTFGTTRFDTDKLGLAIPPAGMAGNAFSGNLVQMGDTLYYYHNDENYHSGIHRWKITGLRTIQEQVIPVNNSMSITERLTSGTDLLIGLPYAKTVGAGSVGWTRFPLNDSTDSKTAYWRVITNAKSYRKNSPDVQIRYNSKVINKVNTVTRSLGMNTNVNSWTLSTTANFDQIIGNNTQGGGYLEVLDDKDRIITRFSIVATLGRDATYRFVAGSNTTLSSGLVTDMVKITTLDQPLLFQSKLGILSVSYAGFSASNLPLVDSEANVRNPQKFRFYAYTLTGGNSYLRGVTLMNMQFYR